MLAASSETGPAFGQRRSEGMEGGREGKEGEVWWNGGGIRRGIVVWDDVGTRCGGVGEEEV